MSGEGRVKGVRSPGLMSGDTLPSYLCYGTYDVNYPHPVNRQTLRKHYLPATSFVGGNDQL